MQEKTVLMNEKNNFEIKTHQFIIKTQSRSGGFCGIEKILKFLNPTIL